MHCMNNSGSDAWRDMYTLQLRTVNDTLLTRFRVYHHILNFGNPLKSGGAVLGSGLALLCIVVMIGIVAEDCECLTMSTVDHPSS